MITKPNPVNIENEKKIVELEATIKRYVNVIFRLVGKLRRD